MIYQGEDIKKAREERLNSLTRGFQTDIEKAIVRNEGDIHPNGLWEWRKTPSGYDWRVIKKERDSEYDHLRTSGRISEYHDIMAREIRKYIERELGDYKRNDSIHLSDSETKKVFDYVEKKFKLTRLEAERQIRGIDYNSKYGIIFMGNMGLFNIVLNKQESKKDKYR